jgi:hypothetical protein
MVYRNTVQTIFGAGLIADKILEMREKDLLKNLHMRVSTFYDRFSRVDNATLCNAKNYASSIYSEFGTSYCRSVLSDGEMYITYIISDIAKDVKILPKDAFISKYTTCEGMSLLNKLKVNRAFILYNGYKSRT